MHATEIEELHRFFEAWFRGELPRDEANFSRLERALAEDFQIVFPSGTRVSRPELVAEVWHNHGSRRHQGSAFAIELRNFELRWSGDGAVLAMYEEWQHAPDGSTARLSSVLFGRDDDAPRGLRWLHLHETWLPAAGHPG